MGVLESFARRARCCSRVACLGREFVALNTKAGSNMAVPRKCSNQPPAVWAKLKCLALKSLSCGSCIKHEPVWPFKRTDRTVFCKTLGGLFARSMCFALSVARPLGSF